MGVGRVTTACLKDIPVHHLVTLHHLLIVLLRKSDATWVWMVPVGGEISVWLKDQIVLLHASHQLLHFAVYQKLDVTMEWTQMDA